MNPKLINDTIQKFKKEKLLKEKIADCLKLSKPKTPKFYLQPNIQKTITLLQLVSSVNCHTSSISKYVGYHLQPIVKDVPCYFQDTKYFLAKLNRIRHIPKEVYLWHLTSNLYTPTFLTMKVLKLSEKPMTNTHLKKYQ